MNDNELRSVLDQIPVGITVTDLDGRILYYNDFCAQIVDRKPEYIGMSIRSCHKKPESIRKIDMIYTEMRDGKLEKYQYESKRKGKILCVTISPYNKWLFNWIYSKHCCQIVLDGKLLSFAYNYYALLEG